jgi:hypothetical protein
MATPAQQRRLYRTLLVAYAFYVFLLFVLGNADSGPTHWLDQLEIALFGRYWTLANLVLLAAPPFAALQVARRRLVKRDELEVATAWLSGRRDREDWIWAGSFVLVAFLVAASLEYRSLGGGEPKVLQAAALELNPFLQNDVGSSVEVHGYPARKALMMERFGTAVHYVPLLGAKPAKKGASASATAPTPADPAAAAAAPPPSAPVAPSIVVESMYPDSDFEVDVATGEVTARGLVVDAPMAARVSGKAIGLDDDRPVVYVRAGATHTRDAVAGGFVLLAGLGAAAAQLKRKKIASEFDREVARNEGVW